MFLPTVFLQGAGTGAGAGAGAGTGAVGAKKHVYDFQTEGKTSTYRALIRMLLTFLSLFLGRRGASYDFGMCNGIRKRIFVP